MARVGRRPEAAPVGEPADPAARISRATRLRRSAARDPAAPPAPAGCRSCCDSRRGSRRPRPPRLRILAQALADAGRRSLPGVEARSRDLQHPAHQRHRETGLLRRDERESHSLSLAKKAVAFFRISRSICRRLVLAPQLREFLALASRQDPGRAPVPRRPRPAAPSVRRAVSVSSSSSRDRRRCSCRSRAPTAPPRPCTLPRTTAAYPAASFHDTLLPHSRASRGVHETGASPTVYHAGWNGLSSPDEAYRALDVLEEAGWVRRREIPTTATGGRPSTLFDINPKVLPPEQS